MNALARTYLLSSISALTFFTSAPAVAQTASPQSTGHQCPDGSVPAAGVSCAPGSTQSQAAGTAGPASVTNDRMPSAGGSPSNDAIVVTGSRIARRGIDSASPIQVIENH